MIILVVGAIVVGQFVLEQKAKRLANELMKGYDLMFQEMEADVKKQADVIVQYIDKSKTELVQKYSFAPMARNRFSKEKFQSPAQR